MEEVDVQAIVRQAIEEFVSQEQVKNEPAYQAELQEERQPPGATGTQAERADHGEQAQPAAAEEAERSSAVRAELQTAGGGEDRPGVQSGAGRRSRGPRTGG